MATIRGPRPRTLNCQRHSGMRSSHQTASIASIWVVSSAAAPPVIARYTPPCRSNCFRLSPESPPLPMTALTPYLSSNPPVNRSILIEVVVPTESGSYRPPALFPLGAVWGANPPRRAAPHPHGPQAEPVDGLQQFCLQCGDRRIGVGRAHGPPDRLLGELHGQI